MSEPILRLIRLVYRVEFGTTKLVIYFDIAKFILLQRRGFHQQRTLAVKTIFPNPLDNSPRLPTLKELGNSHSLAVDASEHKRKFGRVDAETADVGDFSVVASVFVAELHYIAHTSLLQGLVAKKTDGHDSHSASAWSW